jgi:alpha-glucosidase (family GH31 glycosyl hydrolase)
MILALLAPLVHAAELRTHTRDGNRVQFELTEGAARLEWISASTFRFERVGSGALPARARRAGDLVSVTLRDRPEALVFETADLTLTLAKRGLLARVEANGRPLLVDLTEPRFEAGAVVCERIAAPDVRYYGLGPRTDAELNLRGRQVTSARPFLLSTAGYGEAHFTPGVHTFDFADTARYLVRIGGNRLDYVFHYGPMPKEIYEEHLKSRLDADVPAVSGDASWASLANTVRRMAHESLSGVLLSRFDLGPFRKAQPDLTRRAEQLAAFSPEIADAPAAPANPLRDSFRYYFGAYFDEARTRGTPVVRAMPFQFPRDPEAARHGDQLMFGDELLAAPITEPSGKRGVYLPMGIWTNLRTNESFKGRQTIQIAAAPDELPLFARNGAIVPLVRATYVELHYFPSLGAEFFIYETDIGDYSQFHASPAGVYMRLESESKVTREVEWIVHHAEIPRKAMAGDREYVRVNALNALRPGAWFYDAQRKNLHLRVSLAGNENHILNLSYQ